MACDFKIAAIVTGEPDRLISGPAVGPRVLLSREGLARTELIRLGSRAPQRILFKVPASMPLPPMVEELKKVFPDDQISDYKQANQNVTRALDFATSFLSLHQPDRADCGRRRRRHRDARASQTEAGLHRHHEIHRRAVIAGGADLRYPNRDAGAGRGNAGHNHWQRCAAPVPRYPAKVFPGEGRHSMAAGVSLAGNCGGASHHAAVHTAAAVEYSEDQTRNYFPAGHAGCENGLAAMVARR